MQKAKHEKISQDVCCNVLANDPPAIVKDRENVPIGQQVEEVKKVVAEDQPSAWINEFPSFVDKDEDSKQCTIWNEEGVRFPTPNVVSKQQEDIK